MKKIFIIVFLLSAAICMAQLRYYHETGATILRVDENYPGAFVEHRYNSTGADNLFRAFIAVGSADRGIAYGSAHEYSPLYEGTFDLYEGLEIFETYVTVVDSDSTGMPIDSTLDSVVVNTLTNMSYIDTAAGILVHQTVYADVDTGNDISLQLIIENDGDENLSDASGVFFYDGDVPDYLYSDDYPVGIPYLAATGVRDGASDICAGFCMLDPYSDLEIGSWLDWVDTLELPDTSDMDSLIFGSVSWPPDTELTAGDWSAYTRWSIDDLAPGESDTFNFMFLIADSENDFEILAAEVRGDTVIPVVAETHKPRTLSMKISPNPFNTTCKITLESDSPIEGHIEIYNLSGRKVDDIDFNGTHALWDGQDNNGNNLPSGVYLVRALPGDSRSSSGRVILIH